MPLCLSLGGWRMSGHWLIRIRVIAGLPLSISTLFSALYHCHNYYANNNHNLPSFLWRTHTYTHIYTYTHTYIHTHTCSYSCWCANPSAWTGWIASCRHQVSTVYVWLCIFICECVCLYVSVCLLYISWSSRSVPAGVFYSLMLCWGMMRHWV